MRIFVILLVIACNQIYGQVSFTDITVGNSIYTTSFARGLAIADYDNDGDDDVYVACSNEPNRLYRNEGNGQFVDFTAGSGLSINSLSKLSVWFDADNDGWLDLLIGNYTSTSFFWNKGDGTFQLVTQGGLFSGSGPQAILIGDVDGDLWPDVYFHNFNKFNQLFKNFGQLRFRDQTKSSGLEAMNLGMGGVFVDYDNDRDLDVFLVYDGNQPDKLYKNNGAGVFNDVASQVGLDVRTNGMGVDFADFNADGIYDFYISNLFENSFMVSTADKYANIASAAGVHDKGMGWGTVCFDFNNDGLPDIYVVNDYGYSSYPNQLYQNNGNGTFSNVATGSVLEIKGGGFGVGSFDFNSDGALDIAVANYGSKGVKIFRNDNSDLGNWLNINLVGTTSNKFAIGSRVKLKVNGSWQMDDVTVGSGWASQNSFTVHFGVGDALIVDSLVIDWPDGKTESYLNLPANVRYLAIQNESLNPFNVNAYKIALTQPSQLSMPPDPPAEEEIQVLSESTARIWNEVLLNAIRNDFARPTVHARNLFHFSMAMYDAWAAFDESVSTYFLGKQQGSYFCNFNGITQPADIARARDEAISYAAFRLLLQRFGNSPGASTTIPSARKLFATLGYDESFTSIDYSSGSPAALGNYIAAKIIEFGLQDGSNEANQYASLFYQPVNAPMKPELPGNPDCADPNRWQQISLVVSIDQNGQPVANTPPFLSPEWGNVFPFALNENNLNIYQRDGHDWKVYHDPGTPPLLDKVNGTGLSSEYKWNFELVSIWASHLDPSDSVKIDISPASKGNISLSDYPTTVQQYHTFYKLEQGGDIGQGYTINPKTNQPYKAQIVPRGDYARVLAEFWADGPKSETPPGHWFTILNYVTDHPLFKRRFKGEGVELDPLEWDVKSYLILGGALHDVAVTAWGIKGYYDYTRPVFAIRYLAGLGQSSDANLPHYHPAGIELKPGFIELVQVGDPLAGANNENVGKVKLYTWRGPHYIANPKTDMAGVGWILAENWWPYQRPTFVTPPFAGYISGHSTYSSAAAEVLTRLTGDEYFPGGMGEFVAKKNEYLVFEEGPSVDVKLQWARYKDASDQSSLSRIWGGIHPPIDDIPGRSIGKKIGEDAFNHAQRYFNGLVSIADDEIKLSTTLYPNPVIHDWLNIQFSQNISRVSVEIADLTGHTISTEHFQETSNLVTVPTASLKDGFYIVKLRGSNFYLNRKILVKRN